MNNIRSAQQSEIVGECQVHMGKPFMFITTSSENNSVFKCELCVSEGGVSSSSLISIDMILNSSKSTVFMNFPFRDQGIPEAIQQAYLRKNSSQNLIQEIDSSFHKFKKDVNSHIDYIQEIFLSKANQISKNEDLINVYDEISRKQELKNVLLNSNISIEAKSHEIKQLCKTAQDNDSINQIRIRESLITQQALESSINFGSLGIIRDSVIRLLDSISIFPSDFTELNCVTERIEQDNIKLLVEEQMKQIDCVIRKLQLDARERFQQQLKSVSRTLSILQPPSPIINHQNINCNSQKSDLMQRLISELAQISCSNIVENNDGAFEQLDADLLIQLISNKTNFCSEEYLEDVSNALKMFEGIFRQFTVRKPRINRVERESFNQLEDEQLADLAILAREISVLTEMHSERYSKGITPILECQPVSFRVARMLFQEEYYYVSNAEMDELQMQVNQILVKYPIFETLKIKQMCCLELTPTKYLQSEKINIKTNLFGQLFLHFPIYFVGQCVSQMLNNYSGYVVRIKFNKPYGEMSSKNGFLIGLIKDSEINTCLILEKKNCGFYTKANWEGSQKVIRGKNLSSDDVRNVNRSLEFRFCIAQKLFFITDWQHDNVVEWKQTNTVSFDTSENWRFGIAHYRLSESDWVASITELKEIDPEEVNIFKRR